MNGRKFSQFRIFLNYFLHSYLGVLGNVLEEHPELDDEFGRRFDDFITTNGFALTSTEVCKELVRVVANSSIWMKGFQLLGKCAYVCAIFRAIVKLCM